MLQLFQYCITVPELVVVRRQKSRYKSSPTRQDVRDHLGDWAVCIAEASAKSEGANHIHGDFTGLTEQASALQVR